MVDVATEDLDVVIEERSVGNLNPADDFVIYRNIVTGQRWRINGRCNRCGICEVGRVNSPVIFNELIKIGDAEACTDTSIQFRSDVPSLPNIATKAKKQRDDLLAKGEDVSRIAEPCTLSGEYLEPV